MTVSWGGGREESSFNGFSSLNWGEMGKKKGGSKKRDGVFTVARILVKGGERRRTPGRTVWEESGKNKKSC